MRSSTTQSHQRNNGDWNARENSDACYECGRTGHIKKYCPQLKNKSASSSDRDIKEKKFKPRKALLTWDDCDESDKETSEDNDVTQLCFMAKDDHSDEVISTENSDYNKLELDFLELSNHEKLELKNTALKKKVISLLNTVEELEGHVHMDLIKKLLSKELVRGLPKLKFVKDKVSLILIMPDVLSIVKVLEQKQNMLRLAVVVLKFFGCVKPYEILVFP
ncbi:hypothetical protein RJ640_001966 [Escallonia rubra]|uniref:CCHC-type domain-containing protein n=1 Tax=Escallonia rubra TaxID=112253 RepID=A0AA88S2K6_9ASTE|nr:hypothetical protein RJ640_001966 [Escallonia rubra]